MKMIREPFEPKQRDRFRCAGLGARLISERRSSGIARGGVWIPPLVPPFPGRLTGKPADC